MLPSLLTALLTSLPGLVQATSYIDSNDFSRCRPRRANLNLARVEGSEFYLDDPIWTPVDLCPRMIHTALLCLLYPDYCRFPNVNNIHSALNRCLDVEELNLLFNDGRCVESGVELYNWTLNTASEQACSVVKRLVLDGYRFGGPWVEDPWQHPEVKLWGNCTLEWDQANVLVHELRRQETEKRKDETWKTAIDWEQLEVLGINWARNPEEVLIKELAGSGRLKSLRSLEITSVDFVEALHNNTLTNLTWVGRTREGEVERILAHQGESLQSLEYRCDELACPEFLQTFNMSNLAALAPQLEHIAINIPHNGTWPFVDLKALADIPSLQIADLYFRMQSDCHAKEEALGVAPDPFSHDDKFKKVGGPPGTRKGPDRYQTPYLNQSTAADMFAYIRKEKQGLEMQAITFYTGDWSNPTLGGSSYMAWKRARVKCSLENGREVCMAEDYMYWKDRIGNEYEYREAEHSGTEWDGEYTEEQFWEEARGWREQIAREEKEEALAKQWLPGVWNWMCETLGFAFQIAVRADFEHPCHRT